MPSKSPDELKAILRAMTQKGGVERGEKEKQKSDSLKSALSGIDKHQEPNTKNQKELQSPSKQPYEVSEDALRSILKGDT